MASETRTFDELLEAYRKTAIEQSKQTGTSMNDCGMALCGGDILDDLADELKTVAHAEGVAEGEAVGVSAARRQLRAASASVTKQEGTRSIGGIRHYLVPVRAFSVPIASVLAPTKEKP